MKKKFHELVSDILQGKDVDIDELNNSEDIFGKKADRPLTKEDIKLLQSRVNNVELSSIATLAEKPRHTRFNYNEEDSDNLYDGYVLDFFDENFASDFIDDILNFNVKESITPVLEKIKSIIENYYPIQTKPRNLKRDDWKKIYNHELINYGNPISYEYFKRVVLNTPSLIPFLVMMIDLHYKLSEVNEHSRKFFGNYMKLDAKSLLCDIWGLKIEACAESETANEIMCAIASEPMFFDWWFYQPSFALNYWFWIWLTYTFSMNSQSSIDEIFQTNQENIRKLNLDFGLSPRPIEDDKQDTIRTPHNAYTKEDQEDWLICRNIYNQAMEEYRLISFIIKSKKNNYQRSTILSKIENLSLDTNNYDKFLESVEILFNNTEDNWYEKFLEYFDDNCNMVFHMLYEINQIQDFEEMYKYIDKVSRREFAISLVKSECNITNGKSNKTIVNRISEIEYSLKKNKMKENTFDEKIEKFEKLSYLEKFSYLLADTLSKFSSYIHHSTELKCCNLFTTINHLENLLEEYEKNPEQNLD